MSIKTGALLLLLPLVGYAAELRSISASPKRVSVSVLVNQALANNSELKGIEADVEMARALRTQAGLWKNPDLGLQYADRQVTDAMGKKDKGYSEQISLTQLFEFPGKGSLRKALANKDIELAEVGLEQFKAALSGRVRLLAYRYTGAVANTRLATTINDRCLALINLLQQRPRAGTPSFLDDRILEGSLTELQSAVREFEQEKITTLTELNNLRGRPASMPLEIEDSAQPKEISLDLNYLVLQGFNGNRLIQMRSLELTKTDKQIEASYLDAAPDFSVGAFYSKDLAADNDEKLGLSVTLPLPLWNWNQGNIQASRARQTKALATVAQVRQETEAAIVRIFQSHQLVQRQLHQVRADLLSDLESAADLADRQYRLGAITLQTFLETQRQLLGASRIERAAWVDAYSLQLDLELLTGLNLSKDLTSNKL